MVPFSTSLPHSMFTAVLTINKGPMDNKNKSLILINKTVRNRRVMEIVTRTVTLNNNPIPNAKLPNIYRHRSIISLRNNTNISTTRRRSNLPNMKINRHAQKSLTTLNYTRCSVDRITNRRVITRITTITVVINNTRSRKITIMTNKIKPIISLRPIRHIHHQTKNGMFTNSLTSKKTSFKRHRASSSTRRNNSRRRCRGAFRQK